jgi:hypothetical protein
MSHRGKEEQWEIDEEEELLEDTDEGSGLFRPT